MPWFQYWDIGTGMRPYLAVWWVPTVPLLAIVDSGADGSCIPLSLAQLYGVPFDASQKRTSRGAGGLYEEWIASGDVQLESVLGPVVLQQPSIIEGLPHLLLGRRDVFAQFRFCFDQRTMQFQIEPYPPPV